MADPQETTTVPDPSTLTTEQMLREVGNLREALESQIENVEAQADLRMVDLANRIKHGQDVHDERFLSVAQQFQERDLRTELGKTAAKEALDAALASAKELVSSQSASQSLAQDKAEKAITDQIKSLREMVLTEVKALTLQITEIKERLARENGTTTGGQDSIAERRAQEAEERARKAEDGRRMMLMFSAVSIVITVVLFANGIFGA